MLKGFKKKKFRELEKIVKGFANHRRIQILELLEKEPNLSVIDIAEKLGINLKTASEHIRRLAIAGLIEKTALGASFLHKVTARGEKVLKFLRTLE